MYVCECMHADVQNDLQLMSVWFVGAHTCVQMPVCVYVDSVNAYIYIYIIYIYIYVCELA